MDICTRRAIACPKRGWGKGLMIRPMLQHPADMRWLAHSMRRIITIITPMRPTLMRITRWGRFR